MFRSERAFCSRIPPFTLIDGQYLNDRHSPRSYWKSFTRNWRMFRPRLLMAPYCARGTFALRTVQHPPSSCCTVWQGNYISSRAYAPDLWNRRFQYSYASLPCFVSGRAKPQHSLDCSRRRAHVSDVNESTRVREKGCSMVRYPCGPGCTLISRPAKCASTKPMKVMAGELLSR